jgi:hypothetical protein
MIGECVSHRTERLAEIHDRQVDDVAAFLAWLKDLRAILGHHPLWFRGLASTSHTLVPKGLRVRYHVAETQDAEAAREAEEQKFNQAARAFLDFRDQARARYDFPDRLATADLGPWLTLAQHHGLATLLLDWTRNALAAVWFAVRDTPRNRVQIDIQQRAWQEIQSHIESEAPPRILSRLKQLTPPMEQTAAVWAISPRLLSEAYWAESGYPTLDKKMVRFAYRFDDELCDLLNELARDYGMRQRTADEYRSDLVALSVAANEEVPRAFAQRGAFTLHLSSSPLDEKIKAQRAGARCLLPPARQTGFLRELSDLGVEQATMFPDISNFADWINHRVFTM